MADAVDQVLTGKMRPPSGPVRTGFDHVDLPFRAPPGKDELQTQAAGKDAARRTHAQYLLGVLERDGKLRDRYPYPIQVWRFGNGLKLIALGGEVVADYALRLKERHGWDDTWVAGYSNDVFGYVPSLRVLREGGYEGGDAMIHTDLPGPLAEPVEEIILRKAGDLLNAAR